MRRVNGNKQMSHRVRPEVVRRRLLALLDPSNRAVELPSGCSSDWRAGFAEGLRQARAVIRKG